MGISRSRRSTRSAIRSGGASSRSSSPPAGTSSRSRWPRRAGAPRSSWVPSPTRRSCSTRGAGRGSRGVERQGGGARPRHSGRERARRWADGALGPARRRDRARSRSPRSRRSGRRTTGLGARPGSRRRSSSRRRSALEDPAPADQRRARSRRAARSSARSRSIRRSMRARYNWRSWPLNADRPREALARARRGAGRRHALRGGSPSRASGAQAARLAARGRRGARRGATPHPDACPPLEADVRSGASARRARRADAGAPARQLCDGGSDELADLAPRRAAIWTGAIAEYRRLLALDPDARGAGAPGLAETLQQAGDSATPPKRCSPSWSARYPRAAHYRRAARRCRCSRSATRWRRAR